MFELFGDPPRPITGQTRRAYEDPDKWVNCLVLGDSLVVMNSLLHYEGLGAPPPIGGAVTEAIPGGAGPSGYRESK